MKIKEYMQKLNELDSEIYERLPESIKELKNIWDECNAS